MPTESDILLNEARCLGCGSMTMDEMFEAALLTRIYQLAPAHSFIERAGITNATQIAAINQLVVSAQDHGWWDKCDLIYPFVGGTAASHAQNLKSSSFTITWNGTVTHDANGITGNGTTGYGVSGYIPLSSGQMLISSTHVGLYRRTAGNLNGAYCGCRSTSSNRLLIQLDPTVNTSVRFAVNDSGSTTTAVLTSLGWLSSTRNESANKILLTGGADQSFAVAAGTKSPALFHILATFTQGVGAQQPSSVNLAGITAGSGITFSMRQVMSSDWQTFQTALGRQV